MPWLETTKAIALQLIHRRLNEETRRGFLTTGTEELENNYLQLASSNSKQAVLLIP